MNRKESNGKRLLCTSRMLTALIVLSVFTAGIGIAPVSAQVASVTRDLPVFVALNEEFEVTLTQTNFFFGIGTVFETLPEGFKYVVGSYTGNGDVDWDPATPRNLTLGFREDNTVTYRVTASSYGQNAEFAGTYATVVPNPNPPYDPKFIYEEGVVGDDTEVGVDGTPPYTDGHNPAKGATGVPVDTNIEVHVRDDFFVDPNSIVMNVQGSQVTPSKTILGLDHWLVTYDPPGNFNYGFTVVVTIAASDGAGNPMSLDVYSFTTETEDTTLPVITNVSSSAITTNSATIAWDTDEIADSLVKYGTTQGGPYTEQEYNAADVTAHSIGLSGLAADMTYYYVVNSTDPSGNPAQSGEDSFTTLEVAPYCFTIDFATGYNLITMPLDDPSVITAISLMAKIGGNCQEVFKWNATTQSWTPYNAGMPPQAAFDIEGGEGYLVRMSGPANVEFCGEGWTSPFGMSLVTNYNLIGMPVNDTSVTNASALLTEIGATAQEVFKWDKITQSWAPYNAGMPPQAAFDIEGGEGYLVRLTGPANVTFEGDPWQN